MYLKDKTKRLNIRITERDKERLDTLCLNWGCTCTDMIRHFINYNYNHALFPDCFKEGVEDDK